MSFLFCSQREYSEIDGMLYTNGNVGAETGSNFKIFFSKYSLIGRKGPCKNGTIVDDISNYILFDSYLDVILDFLSSDSKLRNQINSCNHIVIRAGGIGTLISVICMIMRHDFHLEIGGCVFNSLWYHGSLLGKFIAPFSYILRLLLIYKAKSVQCVSRNYLQRRYFIRYLNKNNIGISNVRVCANDFKKQTEPHTVNPARVRISYIASFRSSFKGHLDALDFLIFAKKLGKEYHFNFIGVGDYSHLKEYAILNGCIENVSFFDPIDNSCIIDWINQYTDIYIQFSKREGLSRALLEAMSQSKPVLATNVGATSEVVPDYQIIDLTDYNLVIEKINNIFDSQDSILYYSNVSYSNSLLYKSEHLTEIFTKFWSKNFDNK